MRSLTECASESRYQSMERLSLASGIPVQMLRDIDSGAFYPDREIVTVLATLLPGYRYEAKTSVTDLEHERTKGVPDGKTLVALPAKEIITGDRISYSPDSRRSAIAWVEVVKHSLTGRYNTLTFADDRSVRIPVARPVRVLRDAESV